ncbi:MAG TPA: protein kinase [Gemmataceae bacterium]|jgi:serine/threonine protein kinase|nr:protein kinase [Gemmataceae bacterium]
MPQLVECPNGHSWEWSAERSQCPVCGWTSSPTLAGTDNIGTMVDATMPGPPGKGSPSLPNIPGYEILEILGRGGMGVVYKARQIKVNRLVALKMLAAHVSEDSEALRRFRAEAEAVAKLQHPNIVQIFEIGEIDGVPFLALEFVAGGPLNKQIAGKPQSLEFAAGLVETTARAMHYAHQQGIIHRDLKPGNILLVSGGVVSGEWSEKGNRSTTHHSLLTTRQPKIADFGLAKRLEASLAATRVGEILGTPSYMAPEQASGVTQRLTPAVDVYALGAILFEMLTGRPPFLGEDPAHTVMQVIAQEPVSPRRLRPDCPRDLETICLKCLEKNPARRYSTAQALADDLRRYQNGEPIVARPAGMLERLAKWARRKPAIATLAAASTVLTVFILVSGSLHNEQLRRKNQQLSDSAEREQKARKRADANFLKASQTVKEMLAEVGARDLFSIPYLDDVRQKLLEKALESAREFRQQDPGNPQVKRSVAQITTDVADIYRLMDKRGQADQLLQEAWELHEELAARFLDEPIHRREQTQVGIKLANMRADAGKRDQAERIYRDIRAQAQQLAEKWPDDADILSDRAWIDVNHAWLLLNDPKHIHEGEVELIQARDWLKQAAGKKPAEKLHRERLASCMNDMGVFAGAQERLTEARDAYRQVVKLETALAEEEPGNRSYTSLLGIGNRNLGRTYGKLFEKLESDFEQLNLLDAAAGALMHAGQRAELVHDAEEAFQQSVAAFQKLTDQFGRVPQYRSSQALTFEDYGILLIKSGQLARGEQLVESALGIHRQLAEELPTVPIHQANLADVYRVKAIFAGKKGQWGQARQDYLDSIRWLQATVRMDSANIRYRRALADAFWYCAGVDLELREPLLAANRALAMLHTYPEPEYEFWAAEVLARCISQTDDAGLTLMHANLCLELTRRWLAKTGKSTQEIRTNPHFAPMLRLVDFRSMLANIDRERAEKEMTLP